MLSVSEQHKVALIAHFGTHVGKKVLILSPSYPFLFVGKIKAVIADYVRVDVDVTQYPQLENIDWYIHIDQIEVFYIEDEQHPIPKLK